LEGPVRLPDESEVDVCVLPARGAGAPVRTRRALWLLSRHWDVLAVVMLGGALGSLARNAVEVAVPRTPAGFPLATFAVNVFGSLALGALMVVVFEVRPGSRYLRPFLGVGVLGGFTTFSTYAVESRQMLARGALLLADGYTAGSLLAGILAIWAGRSLTRRLTCRRSVR
jgi:fluoride exporter